MSHDSDLQMNVLEELKWEPSVDPNRIGISIKNGIVALTGVVSSFTEKLAAEEAAKRVSGVRAVVNEIEVELPDDVTRSDEDIAAAAIAALNANVLVPPDAIKVTVSKGWVKLEGEVEWQFEKEAAEKAVRYLPGELGVSDLIKVKPRVSPAEIKFKIEGALERSAEVDAQRVRVEVAGGKVTLNGIVSSWAERAEAERAAWAAPGIHTVENRITVEP